MKILSSSFVTIITPRKSFIPHRANWLRCRHRPKGCAYFSNSNFNSDSNSNSRTNLCLSSSFGLSSRLEGLDKPTVWHEFTPLANEHGAINLGQGFPDWDPPSFVVESMVYAVDPSHGRRSNQYTRSAAHQPLANILAEEYSARLSRVIDPLQEIATAVGCTNALFCALQGILSPGNDDEVILIEPSFDIYTAQVRIAGGVPKYVPLRTGTIQTDVASTSASEPITSNSFFKLDFDELQAAITSKTKVLILNSPHNPTGKVFDKNELEKIADIVKMNPHITVISDEVCTCVCLFLQRLLFWCYLFFSLPIRIIFLLSLHPHTSQVYEHIVFDKELYPHISIASLPGMFEQTLTLSSSGKTFSNTGWKVGW